MVDDHLPLSGKSEHLAMSLKPDLVPFLTIDVFLEPVAAAATSGHLIQELVPDLLSTRDSVRTTSLKLAVTFLSPSLSSSLELSAPKIDTRHRTKSEMCSKVMAMK
jgi:hypothetical protein